MPYPLLGRPSPVAMPYRMQAVDPFTLDDCRQESRSGYLPEFVTGSGFFQYSTQGGNSIGVPGSADFGTGRDRIVSSVYLLLSHVPSGSIVNDIPSTAQITFTEPAQQVDPYADSTATGFTFNSAAFPIPATGYTISTAGGNAFGIATNKDNSVAIVDPIHTASQSVM